MTLKLDQLPNANANRAIEIALIQNHSIRFIGTGLAKQYEAWCENRGLEAVSTQPCFCGNLGTSRKACTCTPGRLTNFRIKAFEKPFDIEIKVEDNSTKVYKLLVGELEMEKEAKILDRVKQAQKTVKNVKDKLDDDCKVFLKTVIEKLKLDYQQGLTLLSLTKSIATLDRSNQIQARHLAEASQYIYREEI